MPPAPAESPNVETQLLLRLLGQTENSDGDYCSRMPWDWRAFADACDRHQVASLAFCRLDSFPEHVVPEAVAAHLRDRFYKVSLSNYLLANNLVALASRLEQAGIPVLALKGPAVAMAVYGDLALREYQDLDLLIHSEQLSKAIEVMARAGFQIQPYYGHKTRRDRAEGHHASFHSPDQSHFVELHWQLAGNLWHNFTPEVDKLWSRSETLELPQGRVSTICREDLFLVLCCHGTTHRWCCLKWLVDVAELLRTAGTWNWSRIEEMAEDRQGVRASAGLGMLLAHELLGAPLAAAAAKVLPVTGRVRSLATAIREEILLQGQTDGEAHRTLLALEHSRAARMRYRGTQAVRHTRQWFRQVITVGPKDRALVRLPEKLEFLYPYIRLLRLTVTGSRRVARAVWSRVGRTPRTRF
jgi:hypothetical protein